VFTQRSYAARGLFLCALADSVLPRQQLRQLGDVGGDAPRFVLGQQVGRCTPPRLLLEVEVAERLPVLVADDKAGIVVLLVCPRRRKRRGVMRWKI